MDHPPLDPTTSATVAAVAPSRRELEAMTAGQRMDRLRGMLEISASYVAAAAQTFSIMVEQGDDVSGLPLHLRIALRRVHAQQTLPEVIAQLGGRLRQRTQMLTIPDQRRVLANEPLLYLPSAHEEPIAIAAHHLTPQQVLQVIGEGFIRTPEEQRAILQGTAAPRRAKENTRLLDIQMDKARNGLVIEGVFVARARLARMLKELGAR